MFADDKGASTPEHHHLYELHSRLESRVRQSFSREYMGWNTTSRLGSSRPSTRRNLESTVLKPEVLPSTADAGEAWYLEIVYWSHQRFSKIHFIDLTALLPIIVKRKRIESLFRHTPKYSPLGFRSRRWILAIIWIPGRLLQQSIIVLNNQKG